MKDGFGGAAKVVVESRHSQTLILTLGGLLLLPPNSQHPTSAPAIKGNLDASNM
jgi:hypothetical protein